MTWQLSSELARRVEFSPASGTKLRSKAPRRNITNVSALLVLGCMRDSRSSLARLELLLIGHQVAVAELVVFVSGTSTKTITTGMKPTAVQQASCIARSLRNNSDK
jgi:hypothetical protein